MCNVPLTIIFIHIWKIIEHLPLATQSTCSLWCLLCPRRAALAQQSKRGRAPLSLQRDLWLTARQGKILREALGTAQRYRARCSASLRAELRRSESSTIPAATAHLCPAFCCHCLRPACSPARSGALPCGSTGQPGALGRLCQCTHWDFISLRGSACAMNLGL